MTSPELAGATFCKRLRVVANPAPQGYIASHNGDNKKTVRRQNDDDRRTEEAERRRQEDREEAERREEKRRQEDERRRQEDEHDDDKRTETRRRGVIRKFKVVEENKEEIERKLEDTRRQVQKEILEKINGLEHQLHRTSIADSGDYSTSPGIPLQNSTLMHAERSVHKILKPPTYDGQSSWSMYRRQFEAAAKANGWTPQEMATSLVISLRGQALEILQSIPEEQQNDYDRIVGALEIRYGHKYLRQVYQSQIKSRQQRTNESLQEYEADIERLVHLAYPQAPKEFLEQIGIQTFIDGLLDTEMQQALRLGRHTTICDALIAALEFKAAKEASRSYKSLVRQVKFDECQENQDAQVREMSDQHLFVDSMMNESVISRYKNRSICVKDEWSSEELKKSQKKDSDLKLIRNWLKNGVRPTWQEFPDMVRLSRDTGLNGIPFVFAMAYCIGSGRAPMEYPQFTSWSCLKQESTKDWDKLVPLFLLSYRSSQYESTTYTPSMLTSGREMKLPTDLILGHPVEENQERSLPEFVEDLRERMDRIHRFAREKLKIHSDKMKQRLDTTSTETAFKPGDAVWLYAPKRTKGKSPKLQSNWEGPYTIIKKINDLVYRIQLSPRSKPKVVHLERLARYTGHNPPDWFVVEDPPPRTEDSVIRDE
ncbi:hypothetical protein NQ318_011887 [Aromia moschata]|uniref:Integrase p58-like C-terminal domain-containing protein n=1 Tax=Aromia moschata TaxID=1265417 RepID=A0AAV8Y9T2_9CUCU|nr:hypothetical protein NQ318_011887 [Aromia moschata]